MLVKLVAFGMTLLLLSVVMHDDDGASAATSGAPTARVTPIGVYRGPGQFMSPITSAQGPNSYESFLGRPVNYGLDFQDVDTWSNQEWPSWEADTWQSIGKTVILGTTGVWAGTGSWAQAAAGAYDSHWRTLGERLVATGQAGAILRGAHEFNGDWFPWRVRPGEQDQFTAAWRRWVTVMRSVPNQQFKFSWNPAIGEMALANAETAYPGDSYVDHVALDVYDGWYSRGWKPGVNPPPTGAERDAVWNSIYSGPRGLLFWKQFATAHGKLLALPEWGLRLWTEGDGLVHGGGDNPTFIERMHALINDPSWNIAYHAFWEHYNAGVSDPDSGRPIPVPNSRALFLQLLGGNTDGTRICDAVTLIRET